jgi:hypothetical protein
MHTSAVDIYSDASNSAVMRHPGRRFPGVLIQGDTLHSLCAALDDVCERGRASLQAEVFDDLDDVRGQLRGLLDHYKATLIAHGMQLPFVERHRA